MEWQFNILQSGEIEGWNHAGLAQFRAGALSNLVRETLQNSLDNPNGSNDETTPVEVRFVEHTVENVKVPGLNNLAEHLASCLTHSARANEEARKGIVAALDLAKRSSLKILEIADFNTTGMPGKAGSDQIGKPFHNYLKTSGDSTPDASRGGSHGLGKFAPLANTQLRTIFVSTMWSELGVEKTLFQGLTFLSGRATEGNQTLGQKGFWGNQNFDPMTEVPERFDWMRRSEVGTSIFLIGWDSPKNWDHLVAGHSLINYFAALERGKLNLTIKRVNAPEIRLGRDEDFRKFYENPKIKSALASESEESVEALEKSKFYLDCLANDDEELTQKTQINPGIGASRVSLIKHEDAPQRIAFIRNNILITDQIPTFFRRRSQEFENYAGVFEIENASGNQLMRRMENPSHTLLSTDWLAVDERDSGKRSLKAVGEKLKAIIKDKMTIRSDIEAGPIKILKQFFADEAGEGADNIENEDINPEGKFQIKSKKPKYAPPPVIDIDDQEKDESEIDDEEIPGEVGGSSQLGGGTGGQGGGHGPGHGSGTGGSGGRGQQNRSKHVDSIKFEGKRIISISGQRVLAVLSTSGPIKARLILEEIGADFSEKLNVKACSQGQVRDGGVEVVFKDAQRIQIEFECEKRVVGGVKLLAKEID